MPWVVLLLLCAVPFAAPDRLSQAIGDSQRVTLDRSVSLRAQPAYDQGGIEPAFQINFATLLFRPSIQQQADLDRLLEELQDESSAEYHSWLTRSIRRSLWVERRRSFQGFRVARSVRPED
jgi:hypothetical protein